MSMLTRARNLGRHRAVDEVDRLRDENRRLLTITHRAGDDIALLKRDLADARSKQGQAEELVVQLQADVADRTDERDQLQLQLIAARAELANATRVDVPPMERDTSDGADQATGPIDVRPLWEARGIGPVAVVDNPDATNPAAIRQTLWDRDVVHAEAGEAK